MSILAIGSMASGALAKEGASSGNRRFLAKAQSEGQQCGSSGSDDFYGDCSAGLECMDPAAGSPSGTPRTCQQMGQQETSLLATAARPTAWFVTRQWCGGGSAMARLWAGQCQPAHWDRGLSVVHTCGGDIRNSNANLTQLVYGNAGCRGVPLRTKTVQPGVCMGFPDIDGEASWFCTCGFHPSGGLTNYQSC